ncbi:TPA: trypsin-like peptidase domain-containing protein [Providencia alcalifaciens]|nr:trypsin-like peptidase domain-containing protein [Providencia alcalifaciens]
MDTRQDFIFKESVNIKIIKENNRGRVHGIFIERENASFLNLIFSKVNLPSNAFVEFEYGENILQREFFHNVDEPFILIPSQSVNIRVILPKASYLDHDYSLILSYVVHDSSPTVIIGEDERKPYICYEKTQIAAHALSCGAAKIGGRASCSLIGNENYLLTNNHVVESDPDLASGEIWFNWFNESCDSTSPATEPVRLKPGKVLKYGVSVGDYDYALFTLDDFDYAHSNVKALFGGLALSQNNPVKGDKIYIPQYGDGGLRPMHIADTKNGEHAEILTVINDGEKITYNADSQGGSSGSPVISRETHEVIGLHWGGSNVNVGVSVQNLNAEIGSLIEKSNVPVIGLGNVLSSNLELTPINASEKTIPISLISGSHIEFFDTVKIENKENHSLLTVDTINLITQKTFPITFKASLVSGEYQTHLGDKKATGEVTLKISDIDLKENGVMKAWITFKILNGTENIKNHVIRVIFDNYNPYDAPFEIESADILNFNVNHAQQNRVEYQVKGRDDHGFIALYRHEGPTFLVWYETAYSKVRALLKTELGDEISVNLRGWRETDCSSASLNTATTCVSPNKYTKLILEYFPEDNKHLELKQGTYEGIIPLQARSWDGEASKNILVKVSLVSE